MEIRDFKDDPYLSLLRPLVEAYLAFYRVGNRHIQSMGLTPGQFDVIAELEGTKGLTCAELSERTLTTKGTLTGVLDRLESRGFIHRGAVGGDRRATLIRLTPNGGDMFHDVFPAHAEYLRPFFSRALKPAEIKRAKQFLGRIRDSFSSPLKRTSPPFEEAPNKGKRKGAGIIKSDGRKKPNLSRRRKKMI